MVITPAFLGSELAVVWGIINYHLLPSKLLQNLKHFIVHDSVGQQFGLSCCWSHLGSFWLPDWSWLSKMASLTLSSGCCLSVHGSTCLQDVSLSFFTWWLGSKNSKRENNPQFVIASQASAHDMFTFAPLAKGSHITKTTVREGGNSYRHRYKESYDCIHILHGELSSTHLNSLEINDRKGNKNALPLLCHNGVVVPKKKATHISVIQWQACQSFC